MKSGIMQHDTRDCGAACLATIFLRYKLKVPLVHIREKMAVNRNGASVYTIIKTAEEYNLNGNGLYGSWEDLNNEIKGNFIKFPFIAHVVTDDAQLHYIVIDKIDAKSVKGFDPAKGRFNYTISEFCNLWTGYLIAFNKNMNFRSGNLKKGQYKKYIDILIEQKNLFIAVIMLSVVLAFITIISSLAYQKIIDNYVLSKDINEGLAIANQLYNLFENINSLFIALLCIIFIQMTLSLLRSVLFARITRNSLKNLSVEYCRKLTKLPLTFYHDRETGEILSRFNNIDEVQDILSGVACSIILNVFMTIAGGVVLILISVKLFFIVLTITVFYAFVILAYRIPIRKISRDIMENDARVTSELKETIDGIKTIKAYSKEEKFFIKLHKKIKKYVLKIYSGDLIVASQTSFLGLIEGSGTIVILWIGSIMVVSGEITLGTLIAFLNLVYFFLSPVIGLISLQPQLQQAFIAAERLNDIFEIKEECNKSNDEIEINLKKTSVILKNVSFQYGYDTEILNEISFEINPGEKLAIVGNSGCGKTTLLNLICGFYRPSCGDIYFGDNNFQDVPLSEIRREVVLVPQKAELFTGSLKDNLFIEEKCIDTDIYEKIVTGCCLDSMISKLSFGMETMVEEEGKNFSIGEKQRISIARALFSHSQLMLFDESTSNLDRVTEKKVLDFIWSHCKARTCIFVAHRLSVIQRCDKVIFMKNGRIAQIGKHELLMNDCDEYRELIYGK